MCSSTDGSHGWSEQPAVYPGFRPLCHRDRLFQGPSAGRQRRPRRLLPTAEPAGRSDQHSEPRVEVSWFMSLSSWYTLNQTLSVGLQEVHRLGIHVCVSLGAPQLCGAAVAVHEGCGVPVVCVALCHGGHSTGSTLPLLHSQARCDKRPTFQTTTSNEMYQTRVELFTCRVFIIIFEVLTLH